MVFGEPDRVETEPIGGDCLFLDLTIKFGDIFAGGDVEVVEE